MVTSQFVRTQMRSGQNWNMTTLHSEHQLRVRAASEAHLFIFETHDDKAVVPRLMRWEKISFVTRRSKKNISQISLRPLHGRRNE